MVVAAVPMMAKPARMMAANLLFINAGFECIKMVRKLRIYLVCNQYIIFMDMLSRPFPGFQGLLFPCLSHKGNIETELGNGS